jgi:hypothetical protein
MKHRKIIRLLVIPAALFVILLIVLVMCRRSAICGETYSDRANYAKTLGYSISLPYSAAYTKTTTPCKSSAALIYRCIRARTQYNIHIL